MVRLGQDIHSGEQVKLTTEARAQGVYIIGTTGTGKTSLLKNIVAQDMNDPQRSGVCVLDPHGDMTDDLLELVPEHRKDDVVLFAPGDKKDQYAYPLGLNLLACGDDPHEQELVASTLVSTLYRLFSYSWGPRMEDLLRNGVMTLIERDGSTLLDLWKFLVDQSLQPKYADTLVEVDDYFQWAFWNRLFSGYTPKDKADIVGSSLNKIGRFLGNPMIRAIVGQKRNAFDITEIMDNGGILLCNLSKGKLGEDNSALLGSVLVNLILISALKRGDMPENERRPFHLIVDEYQTFATETFPVLQSEARKYGITVIVAHQYREQLDDLNKGSTMNSANFICLRVSGRDSLELAQQFDNTPPEPDPMWQPIRTQSADYPDWFIRDNTFEVQVPGVRRTYNDVAAERANTLSLLPSFHALCRLANDIHLTEHHVKLTAPPMVNEKQKRRSQAIATRIRARSRERGRDRRLVEAELNRELSSFGMADYVPPARK